MKKYSIVIVNSIIFCAVSMLSIYTAVICFAFALVQIPCTKCLISYGMQDKVLPLSKTVRNTVIYCTCSVIGFLIKQFVLS